MTDSVVRNELGSSDDNNERAVSPSSSSSTSSSTNGNNGNGHRENVSNGNGTNGGSAGNGTASKSRGRGKKEACPPTLINHWRLKPANLVEITFVDPQDLYSKKKGSGAAGSRRNSSPSASSTSSGSSGSDNSPSTSSTSSSNSNSSSSSSCSNSSSSSTPSPTSSNPTSPSEPQHNGAPSPLSLSAPQNGNGNGNGNGTGDSSSADSSKPKPPTPKNSRASYPPTQNHKFVSMQLPAGASELSGIPASVAPTPKPPHMFHDMRSTPMTSFPGIYPTPSLPYPSPVGLPPAYHFSYSSASPNSLASASAFRPFSLPLDNDNRLHVHNVNGNGNGNGQIGNGKTNGNGPSGPGNVKEGEDATAAKELRQIPWATTNGHGGCGDGNDGRNATRYQGEPEEVLFRDGMLFRGANQIPFPFHPPFSNAHLPASLSSQLRGLPIPGQGNGDSNGITNGNDGKVVLPPIKQTLGTEMELRSPEESAPSTGSSGSSSPPSSSSSIPIPMSTTLPCPSASPSINEDAALLEHFRLNPTVHSNSTRPEHLNSASNRDRDNVSLKHSRSWSTDSNLKEQGDRKEGAREHAPPPAATSGNKSVEKITSSHKKMSIGNLVDSPRS